MRELSYKKYNFAAFKFSFRNEIRNRYILYFNGSYRCRQRPLDHDPFLDLSSRAAPPAKPRNPNRNFLGAG
jgi:hypothetical protein